ncbi:MAG: tellurite resistance TerB family protein [Rhodobacteraceae bacterium]|nr:tellurite resistance TerB family protein [Paracoccaceae bacterium]
MLPGKSLLDQFLGPDAMKKVQGMAGGLSGNQKSLATGAAAGGLVALLMSGGKPKKLIKNAVKLGGVALVGGLAYKAYSDWQAGKQPQAAAAGDAPPALPKPEGTVFLPADAGAAEALSLKLVRAMVAAAKADGHVTSAERRKIAAQLPELGLGAEAEALIAEELDAPLDVGRVAALASTPEEAAEIYAASLLVVDPEAPAERGYLAMLAARLKLDPKLVQHLHANAEALVEL